MLPAVRRLSKHGHGIFSFSQLRTSVWSVFFHIYHISSLNNIYANSDSEARVSLKHEFLILLLGEATL